MKPDDDQADAFWICHRSRPTRQETSMHSNPRSILRFSLALALGGLALGLPGIASAAVPSSNATISISNGFLTDHGIVDDVRTVEFGRMGSLVDGANSWSTSIHLTCDEHQVTDALDCTGTLTLDGVSADISMGHEDGGGYWAIESVPVALEVAHVSWMETHLWPESQNQSSSSLPPGWSLVDIGAAVLWYEYDWDWYRAPWESKNGGLCYWDVEVSCIPPGE